MTEYGKQALKWLEEVIPPELRSHRHGQSFLGERFDALKEYIVTCEEEKETPMSQGG